MEYFLWSIKNESDFCEVIVGTVLVLTAPKHQCHLKAISLLHLLMYWGFALIAVPQCRLVGWSVTVVARSAKCCWKRKSVSPQNSSAVLGSDPGIWLHWLWPNKVAQSPKAPANEPHRVITNCRNFTRDFKHLSVPCHVSSRDYDFDLQMKCKNLLSSVKRTSDHWARVQLFFLLAQITHFWCCL